MVEVILAGTGVALVDAGVREGKKARRVEKESWREGRRNVKGGMGQRRRKVGPKGTEEGRDEEDIEEVWWSDRGNSCTVQCH